MARLDLCTIIGGSIAETLSQDAAGKPREHLLEPVTRNCATTLALL